MPLNLKEIIDDNVAAQSDGYSGAVFLTYTLDLGFYEQIVAPALERTGCSNVLIIADPEGYAEALVRGKFKVRYAGLRYVCTPLPRKKHGVQHAKLMFMAGKNRGRLLISSGNLTLYGYSKNLEVYTHFKFDSQDPDAEALLAMQSAWQVISRLRDGIDFPDTARRQLEKIVQDARWLAETPPEVDSFAVWDNYGASLWSRLVNWRAEAGLATFPLEELRVFSPYYDRSGAMLRQFTENLGPGRVNLYLSRENTTLDGPALLQHWPKGLPTPQVWEIRKMRETPGRRLLHAKIIVGVEKTGSWCIAGSANMTQAAFGRSWHQGANLEMVTFHWSPDQTAFDYLLDVLEVSSIDLDAIQVTAAMDTLNAPEKTSSEAIFLTELALEDGVLYGRVSQWPEQNRDADLIFTRSGKRLQITIESDLSFHIPYTESIQTSESAFVRGHQCETFPRWIDVPQALQSYGARSYHERIQTRINTVKGTETLFYELLNFLWERIHSDQPITRISKHFRRQTKRARGEDDTPTENYDTPDVSRFVVPERDALGKYRIERYTRVPYTRHIGSLRDLLSIVLLNLTEPPPVSTEETLDEDPVATHGPTHSAEDERSEQTEKAQIDARVRLCKYLRNYCKKYARRMPQADFLAQSTPAVILENHLTLARVLLEFHHLVPEFTRQDLQKCYWLLWSPFFFPSLIGLDGISFWELCTDHQQRDELMGAWTNANLSFYLVAMTSAAFGNPPSWQIGLYQGQKVSLYLALKKLLDEFRKHFVTDWEKIPPSSDLGISWGQWDDSLQTFRKIASYMPPARERLSLIFDWVEHRDNPAKAQEIAAQIHATNLAGEFKAFQRNPQRLYGMQTLPDKDGYVYCSLCGGALTQNVVHRLNQGQLVLCTACKKAWLYKTQLPSERIDM